jgi:hypothetical protein
MLGAGTTEFDSVAGDSYIGTLAQLGSIFDWNWVLGGSNDDAQWIILAFWKFSDYNNAHGKDASPYTVCLRAFE